MELRELTNRQFAAALFLLLGAALPIPASEQIAPEAVLANPGLAGVLPPGTTAGPLSEAAGAVLTRALLERGPKNWLALLVLQPPGADRKRRARLVLATQQSEKATAVLSLVEEAPDVHMLDLGRRRPDGRLVVSVQWATGPGDHEGKLEVWTLEGKTPVLALSEVVEGFYYRDADGAGKTSLVVYKPEKSSLVILPSVYEWKGEGLVAAPGRHEALERDLLAQYDGLLKSYLEERPEGDPPRMIVDAALLKGRLLERRDQLKEAFRAYALVTRVIPKSLVGGKDDSPERKELLARAAEARRRAAMLARRPMRRR